MRPLRPIHVNFYAFCDGATGLLLGFTLIFSPWAFGTTQPWSTWTMNVAGYLLGLLLLAKSAVRCLRGYNPGRWGTPLSPGKTDAFQTVLSPRLFTSSLALLSILILAYCLISALNPRATFKPSAGSFEYHDAISWLPYSLDATRSWFAFWSYLALACAFWATRDWLLGKTPAEQRMTLHLFSSPFPVKPAESLPARLRFLLWLLALNGFLLAIEGIIQRLEGSGRLLFVVKPRINPDAIAQFGPWAYRANAASYFNLLWPVCLGSWWALHRSRKGMAHHLLLVCAAAIAACPFVATSRGGAAVALAILAASVTLLVTEFLFAGGAAEQRHRLASGMVPILLFAVTALGVGFLLGWRNLEPRLSSVWDSLHSREAIYETARPMARDYPSFGTGPGTFATVFQLYRGSTDTYWPAQLHNDWLETRITFGWFGSALILLALLTVLARCFIPGEVFGESRFVMLLWLALAGCLLHARWDFPFQIYSVLFLFVVLCAVLFTLSLKPQAGAGD